MAALPTGVSQTELDDMFNAVVAAGYTEAQKFTVAQAPRYLRNHIAVLIGTVPGPAGPLPTGVDQNEFNDIARGLIAYGNDYYSRYVANGWPYYLTANLADELAASPLPPVGALAGFDFTKTPGTLPSGAVLTRASTGWNIDVNGNLVSAGNNVARWSYNITSHALRGLLCEPASTNLLRNTDTSMAVNGVTPSPGTFPTNWRVTLSSGITATIVAHGTINGMPYLDVRFQGSGATGSSQFVFESANQPVLASTPYNGAVYVALVAGTTANINPRITNFAGYNNTNIENMANPIVTPTVNLLTANLQRFDFPHVTIAGTTGISAPGLIIRHTIGQPIDLTLRVANPTHEQVATATTRASSAIPTTAGAVTRAADVLTLSPPTGTYNVTIAREAGQTVVNNVVVGGGGYVVPTDPSPLKAVYFE